MNQKVGRNDPCPCGSGKKFKHCCYGKPPAQKPLPFKAKLLSQPKQVDLMSRTFGKYIEAAEQSEQPPLPTELLNENENLEKST
ncbi:MAG: SEC-C metal-binding domain-containing protein [Parachlamydiaceae bacterium]